MVSSNSSRTIPFTTYPCAPASSARCMSTSPSWELRTMMRAFGDLSLIFLIRSKPLMSGNCRSTRATSGLAAKNRSSASPPVAAAPTNLMSGCKLIIAAIPSRTTGWSSTHNTRIFPVSFMNLSCQSHLPMNRFRHASSAALYPSLAFESAFFQLRNATCLLGANRIDAHHPGTGDASERTNSLPYLRLRDFGWQYYRLHVPLAPAYLLVRSDPDAANSGFHHSAHNHYLELESLSVARHSSIARESSWHGHAVTRLRLPGGQPAARHCRSPPSIGALAPPRCQLS